MNSVNDIPDKELVGRVLKFLAAKRPYRSFRQPLWVSVSSYFGLGYTYSVQLCRKYGFDPEMVVRP